MNWKDYIPTRQEEDEDTWTEEDQDEFDDWNQHLEDLEQEED